MGGDTYVVRASDVSARRAQKLKGLIVDYANTHIFQQCQNAKKEPLSLVGGKNGQSRRHQVCGIRYHPGESSLKQERTLG
jgi:hypothetical protein